MDRGATARRIAPTTIASCTTRSRSASAIADYVGRTELYVEGSLQALEQPEFSDRGKMRELLRALDDKTALLDLLERSLTNAGLTVSIGSENYDPRLSSSERGRGVLRRAAPARSAAWRSSARCGWTTTA